MSALFHSSISEEHIHIFEKYSFEWNSFLRHWELICTSLAGALSLTAHSQAVINAFIVSEDDSASPPPLQLSEILFRIHSANKNEASIYGCVRNYPRLLELLCKKKKTLSQCALFLIKNPPLQIPVMAPDTVCLLAGLGDR